MEFELSFLFFLFILNCRVEDAAVVAVLTRPLSEDQILIGYQNGFIVIWDLTAMKVSKSFVLDDDKPVKSSIHFASTHLFCGKFREN